VNTSNSLDPSPPLRCALSIATSDSGSGAGIQADLKTFAAHRVYGLSVLSAVTAQNTMAVTALGCLEPDLVSAQLQAIYDDIPVAAIKIGLLGSAANTDRVAEFLSRNYAGTALVLDPVMVSTSGHTFLAREAVLALKELMALATVVTPNLPEAEALAGGPITGPEDLRAAARTILGTGTKYVLIKGGHGQGPSADDFLLGPEGEYWFPGPRVDTINNHGTGCTLSSAICANLALGLELKEAIRLAKDYVTEGLRQSIKLGHGPGPLNHFHPYYHFAGAEQ
jgi:phosphomethylpyrimidine kinase